MQKNTTEKYLLIFLLLVSVNTSAEGKKTIGTNSPIVTTNSGDVEINKTDLGDSIATQIIRNNQKTDIHLRKKVTKNVFNMLTKLDIPIKIGLSEIFYNNKTNIFHVKNHKTNKIVRIYLNKNINNSITNIFNNNSKTIIKNSKTFIKNTNSDSHDDNRIYYDSHNNNSIHIDQDNSIYLNVGIDLSRKKINNYQKKEHESSYLSINPSSSVNPDIESKKSDYISEWEDGNSNKL